MKEQYALKPCPFCGGKAKLIKARYIPEGEAFGGGVTCERDGCFAFTTFAIKKFVDDVKDEKDCEVATQMVIDAWNRRAEG